MFAKLLISQTPSFPPETIIYICVLVHAVSVSVVSTSCPSDLHFRGKAEAGVLEAPPGKITCMGVIIIIRRSWKTGVPICLIELGILDSSVPCHPSELGWLCPGHVWYGKKNTKKLSPWERKKLLGNQDSWRHLRDSFQQITLLFGFRIILFSTTRCHLVGKDAESGNMLPVGSVCSK